MLFKAGTGGYMRKIMVVDDDRNLASLTKMALVSQGYEVTTIHDGLRVVEEVKKEKPDLILMDIMMPKINGGEVVKSIRKNPDLKSIPVIFLTGLVSEDEDFGSVGVNIEGEKFQSLGKPFELDHLFQVVEFGLKQAGK